MLSFEIERKLNSIIEIFMSRRTEFYKVIKLE
jgi:hypothetical protein